jgi:hypothetical protein
MAHSTATRTASQATRTHSDWYAFLRSAFINGLKAYGASLMTISPVDHLESPASPTLPISPAIVLTPEPKPAFDRKALPQTRLPKPAWSRA